MFKAVRFMNRVKTELCTSLQISLLKHALNLHYSNAICRKQSFFYACPLFTEIFSNTEPIILYLVSIYISAQRLKNVVGLSGVNKFHFLVTLV